MNDTYVTQDDLEMDRRVITLESELTSAFRSFNWSVILLVAAFVGSTFFIYTELSNFKDSNVALQISVSNEFAEIKETFREELTQLDTRLMTQFAELKDSVSDQLLDNTRILGELIARVDSLQPHVVN